MKLSRATAIVAVPVVVFAVLVFTILALYGASSGDAATWFGSLGTVGALFAVVYQINDEHRQRRESDKREQAQHISGWLGIGVEMETPIVLLNGSAEPAYNVAVGFVFVQGAGPRHIEDVKLADHCIPLSILPPGKYRVSGPVGWAGMNRRPGIELAFTDRSGVHWIRRSDGRLDEIDEPPFDYLKLGRPLGLQIPTPE